MKKQEKFFRVEIRNDNDQLIETVYLKEYGKNSACKAARELMTGNKMETISMRAVELCKA